LLFGSQFSIVFLQWAASLMKAIEKFIIEDNGETLRKQVAELELENSNLKATIVESAEEYEVLQLGNASLLAERNDF
jgi:regulator of replication initiation timing